MPADDIRKQAITVIAVAQVFARLSVQATFFCLGIQPFCHPADPFIRQSVIVGQISHLLLIQPHLRSHLIHQDPGKREKAAAVG